MKLEKIKPREIRVFLSSTFKDMEAERNHLIKQVFPKIRTICLRRQVGFTEIDLRWGITEEESKNGATVEICLAEIDRCRDFPPFFIGFLGERYGWIPRHDDLTAYWDARDAEDKLLFDLAPEPANSESQTHPENDETRYEKRIRKAVDQGISVTELEMELAVLAKGAADKLQGHVLFLLRDKTLTDSLYKKETGKAPDHGDRDYYDPAEDKLSKLKKRLRDSPFLEIDGYTSIEQFGQAIEQYLVDQIDRHFPVETTVDQHQLSNIAHSAFRNQRLQNFLPRDDLRQALVTAIENRRTNPELNTILLAGPSGQGKSAIMADLARHLESLPSYRVIDHYIGADGDASIDGLVHRILRTLHPVLSDLNRSIPETSEERKNVLQEWLSMAASRQQCRYVLIIDALDQLLDQGMDIRILRHIYIGTDATVIASAADGTKAVQSARELDFEFHVVAPLHELQRESLITDTLKRYRKGMQPELVRKIAAAAPTRSPLFLMLTIEKLRLNAKHETLSADVDDILAQPDSETLFLTKFLLDEAYGRPGQPTLALEFMALLAASRYGLTEHELSELLALPTDPKPRDTITSEEGLPKLPQIYLSRLFAVFQPFLIGKQSNNRSPMHALLGKAALDGYGSNDVRTKIAQYFSKQQSRLSDGSKNDRMLREIPWQLMMKGDQIALKSFLLSANNFHAMAERYGFNDARWWISSYKHDLALYWVWLRNRGLMVRSEFEQAIDNQRVALSREHPHTAESDGTVNVAKILGDLYQFELNLILQSIGEDRLTKLENFEIPSVFVALNKVRRLFWEAAGTFEALETIKKLVASKIDIPKVLIDGLNNGLKLISEEKEYLTNFIEKYTWGAENSDKLKGMSVSLTNWMPIAQAHFVLSHFDKSGAIYEHLVSSVDFEQVSKEELGELFFEYSKVLFFGGKLEECFAQGVKALQIFDEYFPKGNEEIHVVIKHLFAVALSLPFCEENAQRIMLLFRVCTNHACNASHYLEILKLGLVAASYVEKDMLSNEDKEQIGKHGSSSFRVYIGVQHEQGASKREMKRLAALALPLYRICFGDGTSKTKAIEVIANM